MSRDLWKEGGSNTMCLVCDLEILFLTAEFVKSFLQALSHAGNWRLGMVESATVPKPALIHGTLELTCQG